MKKEDIKKMSDDEFIELLKKHLSKSMVNSIYNGKLSKQDKKKYRSVAITLGLLIGVIPLETAEQLFKKEAPFCLSVNVIIGSILLSYIICSKSRKKETQKKLNQFNDKLIKLKQDIENLSDEEFSILINCYDYIKNNEVIDELIDNINVVEIADKLLEINAVSLLKEFEESYNQNELVKHYKDSEIFKDKVYTKSN